LLSRIYRRLSLDNADEFSNPRVAELNYDRTRICQFIRSRLVPLDHATNDSHTRVLCIDRIEISQKAFFQIELL